MPGRKRRNRRVAPIVVLLVCLVVGFTALSTAQERYGHDFGLPQVNLSSIGELFGQNGEVQRWQEMVDQFDPDEDVVAVHFIDVGQGESILIQAPEKTVLIDGGDNGQGGAVLRHLDAHGVTAIDILIATHAHADHIGGLIDVVAQIEIGEVIMPEVPDEIVSTTRTYTNFLLALLEQGLSVTPATVGDTYELGGGATLTIIGPVRDYNNLNDMSVVSRLAFGNVSFLFTGDIEIAAEHDLAAQGGIRSSVLNIAHHGSRTSTTQVFLDAVSPNIAVISCGLDNQHGHPHRTVIERLQEKGVKILRTDFDGTVILVTNGQSIGVLTEN